MRSFMLAKYLFQWPVRDPEIPSPPPPYRHSCPCRQRSDATVRDRVMSTGETKPLSLIIHCVYAYILSCQIKNISIHISSKTESCWLCSWEGVHAPNCPFLRVCAPALWPCFDWPFSCTPRAVFQSASSHCPQLPRSLLFLVSLQPEMQSSLRNLPS